MDSLLKLAQDYLGVNPSPEAWSAEFGLVVYAVLFLIIFCETGLVVTPFLPGDSLLFAVGAIAALERSPLEVGWLIALLCVAGVLGNMVNYAIGYRVGPKVFSSESSRLFNKKHLLKAQAFYERHGGKAIVLARFVPIVRTFAPFVAGIGRMSYRRYMLYNVLGTLPWVGGITTAGYFFGQNSYVKEHFELVVVAIVVISLIPIVVGYIKDKRRPA